MKNYKEFCGALHLHTKFSDGGAEIEEIINCAKEVGLDYIAITDHMTLKGKVSGGLRGSLFVLVGYEHNDKNNLNHYLAFGTGRVFEKLSVPQEYINAVKEAGGTGFIAHPMERRCYFKKYPPYPWTQWDAEGFDGVELWNQMSEWVENLKSWVSFIRIFYPRRFLSGIQPELLAWWDKVNMKHFVSGMGGVDGHSYRFLIAGIIPVRIFPPKVELKGVRTHVYVPGSSHKEDSNFENMLLDALKNGRGFISYYRRGDARGTEIYLKSVDNKTVLPGRNNIQPVFPLRLLVKIPEKADIFILRNGEIIDRVSAKEYEYNITQRGLYRIEVRMKGRAWIYSNPFPLSIY